MKLWSAMRLFSIENWPRSSKRLENLNGWYSLQKLGLDCRIMLKWIVKKLNVIVRMRFICLRIDTNSETLWTQQWAFGFYERQGIS
jgi:hypothetical protein